MFKWPANLLSWEQRKKELYQIRLEIAALQERERDLRRSCPHKEVTGYAELNYLYPQPGEFDKYSFYKECAVCKHSWRIKEKEFLEIPWELRK